MTWATDDPVYRQHMYVSLGLNDLTHWPPGDFNLILGG